MIVVDMVDIKIFASLAGVLFAFLTVGARGDEFGVLALRTFTFLMTLFAAVILIFAK